LHVGLTIPKLKKTLPENCFTKVLENEIYSNTYTTMVRVEEALNILTTKGINERVPVRQETYSFEDYAGF